MSVSASCSLYAVQFFFYIIYLYLCWVWFKLQMVYEILFFLSAHILLDRDCGLCYDMVSDVCMLLLLVYVMCMSTGV